MWWLNCDKPTCKIVKLFSFISKKWVLLIIKSLSEGTDTFSGVKKDLWDVNSKIISQRMDELQDEGFIERKIVCEKPIKIRYTLTEKWQSFYKELWSITKWADKWGEK